MRVKQDFVTNSSSTSFIVVCRKTLTAEDFINNLWNNGLGESIKNALIKNIQNGGFPFERGLHDLYASSEGDSLFDYLFYYTDVMGSNNILTDSQTFAMREGYRECFTDDPKWAEIVKKEFPPEFQKVIEEYIK